MLKVRVINIIWIAMVSGMLSVAIWIVTTKPAPSSLELKEMSQKVAAQQPVDARNRARQILSAAPAQSPHAAYERP